MRNVSWPLFGDDEVGPLVTKTPYSLSSGHGCKSDLAGMGGVPERGSSKQLTSCVFFARTHLLLQVNPYYPMTRNYCEKKFRENYFSEF